MKLYEIAKSIKELCAKIDETEELQDIFNAVRETKMSFNDKVESCVFVIKELDDLINARKEFIKKIKEHIDAMENKRNGLAEYVLFNMKDSDIPIVKGQYFTVKPVKNPPKITVFDETLIPEKFKKIKTEIVIDKTAIKESIKGGIPVDGAIMEQTERLSIR